jgi:hypothetical protein
VPLTEPLACAGKKKNGKAGRRSTGGEASGRVQLDIETLSLLSKMKLPVPVTVSDIPSLVEKLQEKKAEYEDKQKRALAGEKIPEEEEEEAQAVAQDAAVTHVAANRMSGDVAVNMRCDEAFGQVILEIAVN